jgi:hypothetical protein
MSPITGSKHFLNSQNPQKVIKHKTQQFDINSFSLLKSLMT